MRVEIVAPMRQAPQGRGGRAALAGATALVLALAVAATLSQSGRDAGVELAVMKGHYYANGKIHYFEQAAPPSAYMDPNDNGQLEYRSADTSGLGFAGGGDPYKYIETGNYAKILAHENKIDMGWRNGTFAQQGVKQALASIQALAELKRVNQRGVRRRDETLLKLLSAPVSLSELSAVKGNKGLEASEVRNLNRYIKEQVDSFTPVERKKLESLDHTQLQLLKSTIVQSAVHGTTSLSEKDTSFVPTVQQEVIAEKKRAASMLHTQHQGGSSKTTKPKIVQHQARVVASKKAQPMIVKQKALAEKHPKPLSISAKLHEKLLVKEHELAGPAVKKVEKGGFADIEAARQRNAIAAKVEESITGDEHTGESVIRGDIRSRAAGNVDFNHDAFWDDKEAQKLSHTSVYTATRQTATMATNGYRTTPAMNDPYRYIRTGNYAKILSNEALNTPHLQKTQ